MGIVNHSFPVVKSHMLRASSTPVWQTYVNSGKPLPPRVNNRALYGAVLDQKNLGSCTAFAGTQWRIALHQLAGFPYEHLSELADYYEERLLNGTVSTDSGATTEEAIQVLEQFGGMDESLDPYDVNKFIQAPPDKWDASLRLSPSQAFYINASNIDDVKDALTQGMPIFIAFECFAEIDGGICANTGWLSMPADPNNSVGGHAVNCIGYDDDLGAFLILNQWSDKFGLKQSGLEGCFWMPYAYFTQYVFDVVAGVPDNGAPLQPQPIPLPFVKPRFDSYTATLTLDKTTAHVGDILTATVVVNKNGQLASGMNVDFQINIDDQTINEMGYDTDANGQFTRPFTFTKPCKLDATYYFMTPFGDVVSGSATCVCVDPNAQTKLYHVQVEADSVEANAKATADKVKAAGFPVFIKHEADGLYHVQVGAFLHQSNAEAEKAKLIAAGYVGAYIKFE